MSQSSQSTAAPTLERRVEPLLALLAELEQALVAETTALRSHDAPAILDAVESKRACIRALNDAWNAVSMDAHDVALSSSPARRLTAALERCRALNASAGSAIASLERSVQTGLHLLGGPTETAGYAANGRTLSGPRIRNRAVC